ncbi:MAG: TIR domain-containing protein, partial [Candidatus Hodarchaeota archaeon]
KLSIARTLNYAALASFYLAYFCTNREEIQEIAQNSKNFSGRVWDISKEIENIQYIVDSLFSEVVINFTEVFIVSFKEDEQWKEYAEELILKCDYCLSIAEEYDDIGIQRMIYLSAGIWYGFFGIYCIEEEETQREYINKGLKLLERGLFLTRKTNDKFMIIYTIFWIGLYSLMGERYDFIQKRIFTDLDEVEKLGEIFASNLLMKFTSSFLPSVYYTIIGYISLFKRDQRISYAKKGIKYAMDCVEIQSPQSTLAYQLLTWTYSTLTILATTKEEQKEYAKNMLDYATQGEIIAKMYKGGFAQAFGYAALYRAYRTLSNITESKEERIKMLIAAAEASEKYIKHTIEFRTGIIVAYLRLGTLYEELGILTMNNNTLMKAKETFQRVIKESIERGYHQHAAITFEYLARIEDRLGNHSASSEYYEIARGSHEESLKIIKYRPLRKRVRIKINYTNAWNRIENAKVYHRSENHLKAKESYEEASEILKKVREYNYEAPYYAAWALLEEAEWLSKQEMQEDAIEKYELTKISFENAIKSLEKASKKVKDIREKTRREKLKKVAQIRINYCSARINLEKARILGKQGEHIAAAENFAIAASQFKAICSQFKIEREHRELEAIYILCSAWENMELAENSEEPDKFADAANLFIKASNLFTETKLKLLASGNSAFCQALEFGCKFDESMETKNKAQLYPKVKSMLRKAASSYDKGGFKSGADWALAMSIYFDAAWHLIKADEVLDINERGKLLGIGAKYLKSAAELFSKAGYENKEKEIQNRLNRLEKEEKILISALNTVQIPTISNSTTGIVAPSCPVEISQSPRLSDIREITEESRKTLAAKASTDDIKLDKDKFRVPELATKKMIFLSYSTLDSDYFQIHEIEKRLESYPEIEDVTFWEADSGENIVEFMEKTLRESNITILFCSENSINSEAVKGEWQAAYQIKKKGLMKIIPVYEDEEFIPILLMPMLNVKFSKDDFNRFIENLHKEILR